MTTIGIYTGNTDRGISLFKKYLEGISSKDNVVYARVRYNKTKLTDDDAHPLEYPLVVYTTDHLALCLADVTAGYGGTGPHGMVDLLEYLGFDFNEDDILSNNSVVSLDYLKDNVILKEHFKSYFIPHLSYGEFPVKHR